jgi:hypothetical protein
VQLRVLHKRRVSDRLSEPRRTIKVVAVLVRIARLFGKLITGGVSVWGVIAVAVALFRGRSPWFGGFLIALSWAGAATWIALARRQPAIGPTERPPPDNVVNYYYGDVHQHFYQGEDGKPIQPKPDETPGPPQVHE